MSASTSFTSASSAASAAAAVRARAARVELRVEAALEPLAAQAEAQRADRLDGVAARAARGDDHGGLGGAAEPGLEQQGELAVLVRHERLLGAQRVDAALEREQAEVDVLRLAQRCERCS